MHKTGHSITIAAATGLLAIVAAAIAAPAIGQSRPGNDLVTRIDARTGTYQRYLELLDSPVKAKRVAAFAELVNAGDPALTDMAVQTALASPDPTMQSLALRAGFKQVRSLVARLAPASNATGQDVVKACGDAVQYRIENYSYDKGSFEVLGQDQSGVGQVNGTTVSITIEYGCSMTAKLQPDGSLAGLVSAPYKKGSLPMRATFR